MDNITLVEATKVLREAEQVRKAAEKAATAAANVVAKVRTAESRDKIMKLLNQIEEYTPEIINFDKDLQKEVKHKIRKIMNSAFGENFRITRLSKECNKIYIDYVDAEVVAVLKDIGAVSESTGKKRKEIQTIISRRAINKDDGVFNDNDWSGRDKKKIKDSNNRKNMLYWVDDNMKRLETRARVK